MKGKVTGLKELDGTRIPSHIAFIPDGNRRYAEKNGIDFYTVYSKGAEKARKIARWARNLGVKYFTFYSLSTENLKKRSNKELRSLFKIFKIKLKGLLNDEEIHDTKTQVHIFGEKEKLPKDLREIISKVEEKTRKYDNYHLNFLLSYSGRREIINAVKDILRKEIKPSKVTPELFSSHLYLGRNNIPDPELIIRTSGEERISNFLLWEIAYSEFYFCSALWPNFSFEHLVNAVNSFQERKRRFGE